MHPTDGVFCTHYIKNHSEYGRARQCDECAQHFLSVKMMKDHVRRGKCPGVPVVYSSYSGTLYYRGGDSKKLVSGRLFIQREHNANALVGGRNHREYIKYVDFDEKEKTYDLSELPLGINGRVPLYSHRNFAPALPRLPDGMEVVVVDHDLQNCDELEILCSGVGVDDFSSASASATELLVDETLNSAQIKGKCVLLFY